MKRILFVDDEPGVLEGLERMLRAQRHEWEMMFAAGGEDALRVLERTSVDVVVTDMRMPGIDGATLLQQVHDLYPGVLRIILSGQFNRESGLRAAPVAHQFLSKPCEPGKLKAAINRSSPGGRDLTDEATRRFVGGLGALPSPPRTCALLLEAITESEVSIEQLASIVDQDVAITAKLLQLVNSGFFGHGREVSSVRTAINLLGVDILKQLVVSAGVLNTFRPPRAVHGFSLVEFEKHARLTGQVAGRLAEEMQGENPAVLAGFLHDAGKLVLASFRPTEFEHALTQSREQNRNSCELEHEIMGTTHAEVGGYLLSLWGLPQSVVEAIANHHRPPLPADLENGKLTLAAVIYTANVLVHEQFGAPGAAAVLSGLGAEKRLTEFRCLARQILERG